MIVLEYLWIILKLIGLSLLGIVVIYVLAMTVCSCYFRCKEIHLNRVKGVKSDVKEKDKKSSGCNS